MSTINTYFNTRKSRSNNNNTSSNSSKSNDAKVAASKKVESPTHSFFAAQAPQPIYEEAVKKPAPATATASKSPIRQSVKKNSILYYLLPVHNNNENNTTKNEATSTNNQEQVTPFAATKKAEEQEVIIPCQIRLNISLTRVWNDILQEFDPESYTNQQDSPYHQVEKDEQEELGIEYMDIGSSSLGSNSCRRRKLEEGNSCELRNVRIRSISYQEPSNVSLEEYLLEDIQEDLSRPLRTKYSSNQTNVYLLNIVNEVFILSDNSWFLQ